MTLETTNLDSKLKQADPIIAGILNRRIIRKGNRHKRFCNVIFRKRN